MPSKQETFNRVRDHLLLQGKKSTSEYGCAYRGDDGLMCAAGCLIPDEKYEQRMECTSANSCRVRKVIEDEGHCISLVQELQKAHDLVEVADWPRALEKVAIQFGLESK